MFLDLRSKAKHSFSSTIKECISTTHETLDELLTVGVSTTLQMLRIIIVMIHEQGSPMYKLAMRKLHLIIK